MRKAMMLTVLLLTSAAWLQAQAGYPQPDAAQAPSSSKPSGLTTIQGCLQSSNSQYTLTDSEGTALLLSGAANKLGHQVGRQVELTGKPGIKVVDTTNAGTASSAAELKVFEVKTVKRIADACK